MSPKKEPTSSAGNKGNKANKSTVEAKEKKEKSVKKPRAELKKIEALLQENEILHDRLLRTLAEMDNMRKRSEKERIQWQDAANADLLLAILPVVDDLDRSLKTEQTDEIFREGIGLIYQKMNKILSDKGVTVMVSAGQPFNVDQHDALMQTQKEGVDPGLVIEEYEKGYFLHSRVLRHAKVLVSK